MARKPTTLTFVVHSKGELIAALGALHGMSEAATITLQHCDGKTTYRFPELEDSPAADHRVVEMRVEARNLRLARMVRNLRRRGQVARIYRHAG